MLYLWPFSLLIAAITFFFGVYVLSKAPKDEMSFLYFLCCSFLAFWLITRFAFHQAFSYEAALLWLRFMTVWPFGFAFLLHFILIWAEQDRKLQKKVLLPILYVPAAIVAILDLTITLNANKPQNTAEGWIFQAPNDYIAVISLIWGFSTVFISFLLCFLVYWHNPQSIKKQQAKILTLGFFFSLFGVLIELFSVSFQFQTLLVDSLLILAWCASSGWAIWRYKLFQLTPAIAAESILAAMSNLLLLVDQKGRISSINTAAFDLLGCSQSEITGQEVTSLFPPTFRSEIRTQGKNWIEYLRFYFSRPTETLFLTSNQQKIPILLSVTKIEDTLGNDLGSAFVGSDLSDLKVAEKKLRRQKEELSQFAHTMAHDLQNRLFNIQGYANMLKDEYGPEYVLKINQLALSMSELLKRSVTLADAGLVAEKTDVVDLNDLIATIGENTIPGNIAVARDHLPSVIGDRQKLSELFQNLFENAVNHGKPSMISVKSQIFEDRVDICVSNDGKVIPLDQRDKILRSSFIQEKQVSGIGLIIVKRIIEAHGWQIQLDNAEDTIFRITIPSTELR
ncbi:MAG: ATP-binding protein [Candidatus Thorarchaeota archaeon]